MKKGMSMEVVKLILLVAGTIVIILLIFFLRDGISDVLTKFLE